MYIPIRPACEYNNYKAPGGHSVVLLLRGGYVMFWLHVLFFLRPDGDGGSASFDGMVLPDLFFRVCRASLKNNEFSAKKFCYVCTIL